MRQPKLNKAAVAGKIQNEQMNHDMMNSPEMQNDCLKMLANPEMQKTMKSMMQQPEMQNMMKQMMASDPEFKQTMTDMINNVNVIVNTNEQAPQTESSEPFDHNTHHN